MPSFASPLVLSGSWRARPLGSRYLTSHRPDAELVDWFGHWSVLLCAVAALFGNSDPSACSSFRHVELVRNLFPRVVLVRTCDGSCELKLTITGAAPTASQIDGCLTGLFVKIVRENESLILRPGRGGEVQDCGLENLADLCVVDF